MLRILAAIFLIVSVTPAAQAHTIRSNGKVIDYNGLKAGEDGKTDCCNDKDCRPARSWEHDKQRGVWIFLVPRFVNAEVGPNRMVRVEVPEKAVTHADLGDHKAHWCGTFMHGSDKVEFQRCAFVPPPQGAKLKGRLLDATLRLKRSGQF